MKRKILTGLAVAIALGASPMSASAAKLPDNWDGLVKIKAKLVDGAWLLPGADFRPYTKVMLDNPEVAFRKNWQRDYNDSSLSLSRRISNEEAAEAAQKARTGLLEIFTKEFQESGFQVVTEPGPDVLRLSPGIANLYIDSPDLPSPGRTRTFSVQAGEGTLVLEVRDSLTNALLGRAVDAGVAGDTGGGWAGSYRTSVSNMADFEILFRQWAKASVKGLERLKANSPINPSGTVVAAR